MVHKYLLRSILLSMASFTIIGSFGSCSTDSRIIAQPSLFSFQNVQKTSASQLSAVHTSASPIQAPSFSHRPPVVLTQAAPKDSSQGSADAVDSASPATDVEPKDPIAKACLKCHGPFGKLSKKTADYVNEWDEKVNPHVFVPHDSTTILACTECHELHPLPATSDMQVAKASVQYCYSCHHNETFQACKECHQE